MKIQPQLGSETLPAVYSRRSHSVEVFADTLECQPARSLLAKTVSGEPVFVTRRGSGEPEVVFIGNVVRLEITRHGEYFRVVAELEPVPDEKGA